MGGCEVWLFVSFRKSLRILSMMNVFTNLSTEDEVIGERSSATFSLVLWHVSGQGKKQNSLLVFDSQSGAVGME